MGGVGFVDQLRIKITQSPTGVGVDVGTELGNTKYKLGLSCAKLR